MSFLPPEILLEAKRRVISLAHRGLLLSPKDAWLLSGACRESQTLWSISFQLAMETDVSPEDINSFLEQRYPQYTSTVAKTMHWDDLHRDV